MAWTPKKHNCLSDYRVARNMAQEIRLYRNNRDPWKEATAIGYYRMALFRALKAERELRASGEWFVK